MNFRFATSEDCGKIMFFIKELAEYEKMSDLVVATEEDIRRELFDKKCAVSGFREAASCAFSISAMRKKGLRRLNSGSFAMRIRRRFPGHWQNWRKPV